MSKLPVQGQGAWPFRFVPGGGAWGLLTPFSLLEGRYSVGGLLQSKVPSWQFPGILPWSAAGAPTPCAPVAGLTQLLLVLRRCYCTIRLFFQLIEIVNSLILCNLTSVCIKNSQQKKARLGQLSWMLLSWEEKAVCKLELVQRCHFGLWISGTAKLFVSAFLAWEVILWTVIVPYNFCRWKNSSENLKMIFENKYRVYKNTE